MKTFTIKELCDKCAELRSEYIKEPGIIYFDIFVYPNYCVRISFSTMSTHKAVSGSEKRYFCANIREDNFHAFIELKPAE